MSSAGDKIRTYVPLCLHASLERLGLDVVRRDGLTPTR
jgi:hypothetical protein